MPITILPEWESLTNAAIAAMLEVSPTAVMYARRRAKGHCERCDTPAVPGERLCVAHEAAITAKRRRRGGHMPWKPGTRGRPPKFTSGL
jgi:hypothetical protein